MRKPAEKRKEKSNARSQPEILIGYSKEDGYRVLLESSDIVETKDVNFNE